MKSYQIIFKIFKNPAILYTISRYVTYAIQFISSMYIAMKLGPYYLGIWGFVNLIIGYILQFNFGISQSVNVIVSVNKNDEIYAQKIIANGMFMMFILSLVTIIFFVSINVLGIKIGEKYNFYKFVAPVMILTVATNFASFMSAFFRIYGRILSLAAYQSLYPILALLVIPFFKGEKLIWAMLVVNIISFLIFVFYFYLKSPIKISFNFNWNLVKIIQIRGWYLFIYNSSFYLILLTTRTFISKYYSVEDFGLFTFSYSLANIVLLLLNSISFLIFPKMLNRFAKASTNEVQQILKSLRIAYISLSHFLIHIVILFFPLFILFFPQYSTATISFRIIALTVVLYTNSFGYQGYLIAKGEEKKIAIVALIALLLNILFSYTLIHVFKVQYSIVILATMGTYIIYVFVSAKIGRKKLQLDNSFIKTFIDVYPIRMMLPFILSLLLIFTKANDWFYIIPLALYILLNIKDLLGIKNMIHKMIVNPNFINI